jgi:DNA replication and repair protein RecF
LILSDLLLSHFRSHRRTVLAFDGRPVAIHGPNGAGKTNILEAMSLLSPGRGLRRAGTEDLSRRPEALGWKVAATVGGHEIETLAEGGAARSVMIDGKPATQVALGQLARILWLVPAMDRLWIEGAEGRRRFLDRMVLSFIPAHAEEALAYEKAMRERNRLLKDEVRDPGWYGALEAQMAEAGAAIRANRRQVICRIGEAQDVAETAFPAADLALLDPDTEAPAETAEALAAAFASGRARDMAAGRTLTGPHRTDVSAVYRAKAAPAAQCSTGEQKALLVSLILANARALKADTGFAPLLLLDEVAAHLDEVRRAALYEEIIGLGAQAFMTGTGPELFAALGSRAAWLEVFDEDGQSRVATGGPP